MSQSFRLLPALCRPLTDTAFISQWPEDSSLSPRINTHSERNNKFLQWIPHNNSLTHKNPEAFKERLFHSTWGPHSSVFRIKLVFYQNSVQHKISLILGWSPKDQKVFQIERFGVMVDHFCFHRQPNVDDQAETRCLHTVLNHTWPFSFLIPVWV